MKKIKFYNKMEKIITINDEPSLFIYKTNILNAMELEELIRWINLQKFKSGHCLTGKEVSRQQIWYQKDRHYFCDSWKVKYDRWVSESESDSVLLLTVKAPNI